MTYNEDCLEGMKRIPSGTVDLILTDLPYGITDAAFDQRIALEPMWEQFLRVTKENAAICLFAAGKFLIELAYSQLKLYRYKWVWRKSLATGFLNAKKMPLRAHEDILVFYRRLPTYNPQFTQGKPYSRGGSHTTPLYHGRRELVCSKYVETDKRYPRDEIKMPQPHVGYNQTAHVNQKPIALLEYLIRTYSNEGELVLDATMGSGSTGVACVNTGRNFIGFETERQFYDIAEERISKALAEKEQALF